MLLASAKQSIPIYGTKLSAKPIAGQCIRWAGTKKPVIDRSKVPVIDEKDLEEKFINGSGPGGQSVNKTINCCQLRHKPTGLVLKVHQTRSLQKNRQIARELMVQKLDDLLNGEDSVSNQKKRIDMKHTAVREAQKERIRGLKEFRRKFVYDDPLVDRRDISGGYDDR